MSTIHKYKNELQMSCWWCKGNHSSRKCNSELLIKKELKKKVGHVMEKFVEQCIQCPRCSFVNDDTNYNFERLGNNTPSLDVQCRVCGLQVEVKSKCLSVNNLPDNIYCKGGNYNMLYHNILDNDLNIIIIIYSADRNSKNITIKEVLWINNNELMSNTNVFIERDDKSTLSNIIISNRNIIPKLPFEIKNISFTSYVQKKIRDLNLLYLTI